MRQQQEGVGGVVGDDLGVEVPQWGEMKGKWMKTQHMSGSCGGHMETRCGNGDGGGWGGVGEGLRSRTLRSHYLCQTTPALLCL